MTADRDELKRAAAERALEFVENGMILGLGTGTTAGFVIEGLARRIAQGLAVRAIPTSEHTAALARNVGIPLTDFAAHRRIDLAIDGADEVERESLSLIKGAGGALLREKIVANASARFVVVVDHGKLVERLGAHMPVPVEVSRFGWQATAAVLDRLGLHPELRQADGRPFVSDGGNCIIDCRAGPIADPTALECRLNMIPGVVENGLFVGRAAAVVVASPDRIEVLTR
ncbi:MAG TPA: ribose-5-phosphate isomerase RpiA [Stellaceae bacterium]|nr:ribose-5-phosphate isomerase RpiA [Stellaceae bacterium]